MNLGLMLDLCVKDFGEFEQFTFQARPWTNVEALDAVQRIAGGLVTRLAHGERVLTLIPNRPENLMTNAALWRAGLVMGPLHALTPANDLGRIAAFLEARAIITSRILLPMVIATFEAAPSPPTIIVWPDAGSPSVPPAEPLPTHDKLEIVSIDQLMASTPLIEPRHHSDDDLAVVMFTGGTTGRPKAVMLTHASLTHTVHALPNRDWRRSVMIVLPLNHIAGVAYSTFFIRFGYRLVWGNGFTPADVLQTIEKYGVQLVGSAPSVFLGILAYPDAGKYDTSTAKNWEYGAASFPEVQLQQFKERFKCEVAAAWGLTEATAPCTSTNHSSTYKPGSCGRINAGMKLRIAGPDGSELPTGEIGEVWLAGPQLMRGYYKMPAETAQVMADGWLRTGDVGRVDADGDLFLVGRIKDIILRGGENVYPDEVESVIALHPAIMVCSVVGVPNDLMGEEVVGYLMIRPDADPRRVIDEVRALCRDNLTPYKIPRFEVIGEIPKTPIGKTDRRRLREIAIERLSANTETPTSQRIRRAPASRRRALLTNVVRTMISELLGVPRDQLDLRTGFIELGLESSQAVELAFQLGTELGLHLSGTLAFKAPTGETLVDELLVLMFGGAAKPVARPRQAKSEEPLAVVGMAYRMPGGIVDDETLWRALLAGHDTATELPTWRWNDEPHGGPKFGNTMGDIDKFDAGFFHISPSEARDMDPQQRVLLETSWSALENAGIAPGSLGGSPTGIFVGIGSMDYLYDHLGGIGYAGSTGGMQSVAVGRVSYVLGLHGPALATDTACSSSLTAMHLAIRALRGGECDVALAGGVSMCIAPQGYTALASMGALSPDGRCKTFDASADGYGRAEGCGILVLMRLSDAVARGHTIRAVVRGSAINHDGYSTSLTAPNGGSQEEVLRAALADSGLAPEDVSVIEAHGTGTPTGDPIEVDALVRVFGTHTGRTERMYLSSFKSIVGHMEFAAGVGGVIRSILSLEHREITPMAQLRAINPLLRLENANATIPIDSVPWRSDRRVVGVSSFGFGGSNAHTLLEQAPEPAELVRPEVARPVHILPISARHPEALDRLVGRYQRHLTAYPSLRIEDICYTAGVGRSHLDQRLALVVPAGTRVRDLVKAAAAGAPRAGILRGARPIGAATTAMLFTGQGAQWSRMGQGLYETEPVYRAALDECATHLNKHLVRPLLDVLFAAEGSELGELLHRTAYTQPALFAVEWALYQLWSSWGVKPDVVMGHSVGELVAAAAAGVFSLADGCKLVAARGRLMDALPDGGAMVSVDASEADVADLVASVADRVSLAAVNGPSQVVLSGDARALDALVATFTARGVTTKRLRVSHAFHSPLIEPMMEEFRKVAATVRYEAPSIPIASNLTGALLDDEFVPDADYWVKHVRGAVRFLQGMNAIAAIGRVMFIEVGPHPVLVGMGREFVPDAGHAWVPSLRRNEPDWSALAHGVAAFYVAGGELDWQAFSAGAPGRRIGLPSYAFDKTRFWVDRNTRGDHGGALSHPLIQGRTELPGGVQMSGQLGGDQVRFLLDHRVHGVAIMPATGFLEMVLAAAQEVFGSDPTVLEDVTFEQALAIGSQARQTISVLLRTPVDGAAEFELHSHATTEDGAIPVWTLHVRGRVRVGDAAAPHGGALPAELEAKLSVPHAVDRMYADFLASGVEFGPTFRNVTSARSSTHGGEAMGRVSLTGEQREQASRYQIHPTVLDSAMHVVFVAPAIKAAIDGATLPVAIRRVVLSHRGVADAWVHTDARVEGDDVVADIQLFDDRGSVVAQLEGFVFHKVEAELLRRVLGLDIRESMYQLGWEPKVAAAAPAVVGRWLVLADRAGVGGAFAAALERAGGTALIVAPGSVDGADRTAVEQVIERAGAPLDGVLSLWGLDASDPGADGEPTRAHRATVGLLHVAQALSTLAGPPPRLVVATRGAELVNDAERSSPAEAAVLGLARVVAEETPGLACAVLDLDPADIHPARDAELLLASAMTKDGEVEVAYRDGARHIARLKRRAELQLRRPTAGFELHIQKPSVLDSLAMIPLQRRAPAPGEVEVKVRVAAMNFRDVLIALGMYPGPPQPLGNECVGEVSAVGDGVTDLAVGDDVVVGLVPGAFRSHVLTDARMVARRPVKLLTDDQAASLPTVFLTALLGLDRIAKLKRGERILIHAGAGGVGLAAIQVAQAAGAEVIATAGSPRKRAYLHGLGVQHVFDSRSLSFVEDVRRVVGDAGLDVVLNSLAEEFIAPSMALLKPGGRFIEIGKARWLRDDEVPSGVFYRAFDLGDECLKDWPLWKSLWAQLCDGLERGIYHTLPVRRFAVENAVAAFRFISQGKHVGKVVLAFADSPAAAPRADGTYLITGGTGGLGLKVAAWLLARGAGHVALMSRRGSTPEAEQAAAVLDPTRQRVSLVAGDVARMADVERVLQDIDARLPPLRGVFHAAGVLEDALLGDQRAASLTRVFTPKVVGGWNLHRATATRSLDMFVLFSSVAAFGNAGQANYAAANAFLDGLAAARRTAGLAALTINWGPWAESGMGADVALERIRAAQGVNGIAPSEGIKALELLLDEGAERAIVLDVDWKLFTKGAGRSPLFSRFAVRTTNRADRGAAAIQRELMALGPTDRIARIAVVLRQEIGQALGAPAEQVRNDLQLRQMGLDSLQSLELRNRLNERFGVSLSMVESAVKNVEEIATRVASELERTVAPAPVAPALVGPAPVARAPVATAVAPSAHHNNGEHDRTPERASTVEVGALRLGVLEWGPTSGPAVVCVHGFLDQALAWRPVAQRLARQGLRVVALDLPGHGRSDHIPGTGGYPLLEALRSIDAVVERFQARLLIGHSLGGATSLAVAAARSESLGGLVLIDAPIARPPQPVVPPIDAVRGLLGADPAPQPNLVFATEAQAAALMKQALPTGTDEAFVMDLTRRLLREVPGGFTWRSDPRTKLPLEGWRGVMDLLSQPTAIAPRLPVLGVFVRNSPVSTPRCPEALRTLFPQTRLAEVATGHWPHLEVPDAITELITTFLHEAKPTMGRAPEINDAL